MTTCPVCGEPHTEQTRLLKETVFHCDNDHNWTESGDVLIGGEV